MSIYENVGKNIRQYRKAINWSQEDLAYYCGLTLSCVSKIERGNANPTLHSLDVIADALGIETYLLLQF